MKPLKLFSFRPALFSAANAIAQIDHAGTTQLVGGDENPDLQLLIHGTRLPKQLLHQLPGEHKKRTKGDSPNYLFLDPLIGKTTKPGALPSVSAKTGGRFTVTFMNRKRAGR